MYLVSAKNGSNEDFVGPGFKANGASLNCTIFSDYYLHRCIIVNYYIDNSIRRAAFVQTVFVFEEGAIF